MLNVVWGMKCVKFLGLSMCCVVLLFEDDVVGCCVDRVFLFVSMR